MIYLSKFQNAIIHQHKYISKRLTFSYYDIKYKERGGNLGYSIHHIIVWGELTATC
jgi:hypothetical protein